MVVHAPQCAKAIKRNTNTLLRCIFLRNHCAVLVKSHVYPVALHPAPFFYNASESLLEGTRSHSDPGDDSHDVKDVRANCLEGYQETKHLSETLELNIEKCQTNVSVIVI